MNAQDLMPFCSTYRETMLLPFTHGPWTYASDGRIIVRIPALDTVPPRDHQPKDPEKAIPASSAGLTLAELPPCYDSLYPVFVKSMATAPSNAPNANTKNHAGTAKAMA
jgi:hypothetical protein